MAPQLASRNGHRLSLEKERKKGGTKKEQTPGAQAPRRTMLRSARARKPQFVAATSSARQVPLSPRFSTPISQVSVAIDLYFALAWRGRRRRSSIGRGNCARKEEIVAFRSLPPGKISLSLSTREKNVLPLFSLTSSSISTSASRLHLRTLPPPISPLSRGERRNRTPKLYIRGASGSSSPY